jgi:hypothetical protein
MALTKSQGNDIEVLAANGLSIFVDDNDSELKLKDTNGDIEPVIDFLANITDTPLYYGSFVDTTTQTSLGNEQKAMTFNTTILSQGISIENNSRIKVNHTGIYNLQFSAQIKKTSGGQAQQIYIWFKINGVTVPDSNTALTLANNGDLVVAAWNFMAQLNANQYMEIFWYATASTIELHYDSSPVVGLPAIPSIIATMNRVG